MKHARPCQHSRVIKTKSGLKRIMINPGIVKKRRKNYGDHPQTGETTPKEAGDILSNLNNKEPKLRLKRRHPKVEGFWDPINRRWN